MMGPRSGTLCLLLLFTLAVPQDLLGAEKEKAPPAESGDGGNAEETVVMPVLVVPVMQGDRFWGQAYVSVELVVPSDIWKVRTKIPALQDTLVRTAHARPIVFASDEAPPIQAEPGFKPLDPLLSHLKEAAHETLDNDLVKGVIAPSAFFRPL